MHEQLQASVSKGPKEISHSDDHSKANDKMWLAKFSPSSTLIKVLA